MGSLCDSIHALGFITLDENNFYKVPFIQKGFIKEAIVHLYLKSLVNN